MKFKKIFVTILSLLIILTMSFTCFCGNLIKNNALGIMYIENNECVLNSWVWIDSNSDGKEECFYFNDKGILISNTITPDGYKVNEAGQWVDDLGNIIYKDSFLNNSYNSNITLNQDGTWVNTEYGYVYVYLSGNFAKNEWVWINKNKNNQNEIVKYCYYFNPAGFLVVNTITPDGYKVNEVGQWIDDNGIAYSLNLDNSTTNLSSNTIFNINLNDTTSQTITSQNISNNLAKPSGNKYMINDIAYMSDAEIVDKVNFSNKTWNNVIKINKNNGFLHVNAPEKYNKLTFEVGCPNIVSNENDGWFGSSSNNKNYNLVISQNGNEIDSFSEFSEEGTEKCEVHFNPNNGPLEITGYISDEDTSFYSNGAIYIRNGVFSKDKNYEEDDE